MAARILRWRDVAWPFTPSLVRSALLILLVLLVVLAGLPALVGAAGPDLPIPA